MCGIVFFLGGIGVGWLLHYWTVEPRLTNYEDELTKAREHGALTLAYDPYSLPLSYDVGGIFKVSLKVDYEWYQIRGNITNLTEAVMNEVCVVCIPRYPDQSLDVEYRIEHTEVEILRSQQTKDFSLMIIDLEDRQPFDLLIIY